MKRLRSLVLGLFALCSMVGMAQEAEADDTGYIVKVGQVAPDFTVTLTDGRTVTLRRTGKLNAEMRFVRGQAHDSLYDMGFGAMMISVVTEDMTVLLNEHGGVLDLEYRVEVEHALCSRNHYHIEIQTI